MSLLYPYSNQVSANGRGVGLYGLSKRGAEVEKG